MSILTAVWDVLAEARQIETLSHTKMFACIAVRYPEETDIVVRKGNYEGLKTHLTRMCLEEGLYDFLTKDDLAKYCRSLNLSTVRKTRTELIQRLRTYDQFGKTK